MILYCAETNCLLNLVKLIASFLISYPLAGLLKRVPDARPEQKNLFIIGYAPTRLCSLPLPWRQLTFDCF